MNRDALRALLVKHEGLRLLPYKDTVGKTSIGIGRNLDDVGITEAEAYFLLENDISRALDFCTHAFPWFNGLCDTRQTVLVSMCFNIGPLGLSKFRRMLAAIAISDFEAAANEMRASTWAGQVGSRAAELAQMMQDGDVLH